MGRPRKPDKFVPVTIRLAPDVLDDVDEYAEREGLTRTAAFRRIVAFGSTIVDRPGQESDISVGDVFEHVNA
jgi:hypothetical protein